MYFVTKIPLFIFLLSERLSEDKILHPLRMILTVTSPHNYSTSAYLIIVCVEKMQLRVSCSIVCRSFLSSGLNRFIRSVLTSSKNCSSNQIEHPEKKGDIPVAN